MSNETEPGDGGRRETLDIAIDRAVQRMMAAEPRPGLRHRVAARLRDGRAPAWRWVPRLALAGGAFAALILTVTVMRPAIPAEPPQQPSTVATTKAPAAPAGPAPLMETPAAPAAVPPAPAGPRREKLPEPPQMADVFGAANPRVAAASVPAGPLDDPDTPETEPGTVFRSPIASLPPLRLEALDIPIVPIALPRITPM